MPNNAETTFEDGLREIYMTLKMLKETQPHEGVMAGVYLTTQVGEETGKVFVCLAEDTE